MHTTWRPLLNAISWCQALTLHPTASPWPEWLFHLCDWNCCSQSQVTQETTLKTTMKWGTQTLHHMHTTRRPLQQYMQLPPVNKHTQPRMFHSTSNKNGLLNTIWGKSKTKEIQRWDSQSKHSLQSCVPSIKTLGPYSCRIYSPGSTKNKKCSPPPISILTPAAHWQKVLFYSSTAFVPNLFPLATANINLNPQRAKMASNCAVAVC